MIIKSQYLNLIINNKPFTLLFMARTFSLLGTQMHRFGLPWLVLQVSGSASLMALNFTFSLLPGLIFGYLGGVLADKYNRKKIMIIGDLLAFVFSLSLFLLHYSEVNIHVVYLFILTIILSSLTTIYNTSFDATLPQVVNESELIIANSLFNIVQSFINLSGPVIAGMIIGFIGGWSTILLNAISFLISGILVLFIKFTFDNCSIKNEEWNWSFLKNYLYTNTWFKDGLIITGAMFLATGSVGSLIQLYLIEYLNLTGIKFGLTFSLFEFIPIFIMSLLTPKLKGKFQYHHLILFSTLIYSTSLILMGATVNYWIVLASGMILNGSSIVVLICWNTVRQEKVPNNILGKITGVALTVQSIGLPLGGALSSLLLNYLSAQIVLVLFGSISIIIISPFLFKYTARNKI
ncbi:MFS transporter [Staphylococcus xylosus]